MNDVIPATRLHLLKRASRFSLFAFILLLLLGLMLQLLLLLPFASADDTDALSSIHAIYVDHLGTGKSAEEFSKNLTHRLAKSGIRVTENRDEADAVLLGTFTNLGEESAANNANATMSARYASMNPNAQGTTIPQGNPMTLENTQVSLRLQTKSGNTLWNYSSRAPLASQLAKRAAKELSQLLPPAEKPAKDE